MRSFFQCILLFFAAAAFAAPVSYADIDGAKRRDEAAGTIDIAIGGPEKGKSADLFRMENTGFQLFGKEGKVSAGFLPGSHRKDNVWNTPKAGERDGIPVAVITENYQPLLCVLPEKGGIALPVTTRRGAWLACRLYGGMTFTLHPNDSGHRNISVGKKGEWTEETRELPAGQLNIGPDGVWRGYRAVQWSHANTLIQSYGAGEVAYIAILPATRIKLPAGMKTLEFTMLDKEGGKTAFSNPIPANASEAAVVHLAPHASQLVWKLPAGWTGGRVIRNTFKENCLTIVDNTFILK